MEETRPTIIARNAAALTTIFFLGLGILQIILGETISRSVALTANGIDSIGDGFVSAIVWIGLNFFRRPADRKFHFGYYKIENFASIIAAVIIIVLAGYIGYRSYNQLLKPQVIVLPVLGMVIAGVGAVLAFGLGVYKIQRVRRSKLSSAKLDAINTIKDGTTSILTVIALLVSAQGYPLADAVVGFIIAGIILSIAFAALKESGYMLVDACDHACVDQQQIIRTIVKKVPGVQSIQDVRLRRSGPIAQGEVEIVVAREMTVVELDTIRSQIQQVLKKDLPDIERLTVIAVPETIKK